MTLPHPGRQCGATLPGPCTGRWALPALAGPVAFSWAQPVNRGRWMRVTGNRLDLAEMHEEERSGKGGAHFLAGQLEQMPVGVESRPISVASSEEPLLVSPSRRGWGACQANTRARTSAGIASIRCQSSGGKFSRNRTRTVLGKHRGQGGAGAPPQREAILRKRPSLRQRKAWPN